MSKYCGKVKEVSGTSGGGYVAVGRSHESDNYQSISEPIGGVVSVATEPPLLTIGNTTFRKIRLQKVPSSRCQSTRNSEPSSTLIPLILQHGQQWDRLNLPNYFEAG